MKFDEGEITAALHLTSLGHNELSIVRLEEERTFSELVTCRQPVPPQLDLIVNKY